MTALAKGLRDSAPSDGAPRDRDLREDCEGLLFLEAELLDAARWEDWLSLYTEDCWYWIPSAYGQAERTRNISLVNDERQQLELRVKRLLHPDIHSQIPASHTCHLIGNVRLANDVPREGEVTVRSNFVVTEHRVLDTRQPTRVFSGHCEHRLRRAGAQWKIAHKTLRLTDAPDFHRGIAVIL